jgi:CHAT domain-containing protein
MKKAKFSSHVLIAVSSILPAIAAYSALFPARAQTPLEVYQPAPQDPADVIYAFGVPFETANGCPAPPEVAAKEDDKLIDRFRWLVNRNRFGYAASGMTLDQIKKGNISTAIRMSEILERSTNNRFQQSLAAAISSLAYSNAGNASRARSKAGEARAYNADNNTIRERLVVLAEASSRELRGEYADAETILRKGIETISRVSASDEGLPILRERLARVLLGRGRINEAEAVLRAAIRGVQYSGLSVDGASAASLFSSIYLQRNLPGPALHLAKLSVNKLETACISQTSLLYNDSLRAVAQAHLSSREWAAVISVFEKIRQNLITLPEVYSRRYATDPSLPWAYFQLGDAASAARISEMGATTAQQAFGANSPDFLRLRAIQLLASDRIAGSAGDVARVHAGLFENGLPNVGASKDPLSRRFENEILAYHFRRLVEVGLASEAFAVADRLRSGTVQQAIANAAARASIRDPKLQEIVRQEQDVHQQIDALSLTLANAVSGIDTGQSPEQVRGEIQKLREQRSRLRSTIDREFRTYSNLINPRAPSISEVRAALGEREAFVSFAVEEDATYVWVITKAGEPLLHSSKGLGTARVREVVRALRKSLSPDAGAISEIPAFDLDLAYRLYADLLAPVALAWDGADTLIISATDALAEIPLHLLPTAPARRAMPEGVLFEGYRDVPWLIRSKSIVQASTAAAFVNLRENSSSSATRSGTVREPFIGFGDPLFNPRQVSEFNKERETGNLILASRGFGSFRSIGRDEDGQNWEMRAPNSRYLRALPRLPETSGEILSIARELGAGGDRVFLGLSANEETVRRTNLQNAKVVMFATHGLMAGDLPGLHEPALAMTPPDVAGTKGDGFLTMSEIMTLNLNADWVVLSACNTGASNGRGSELASGLGRAFFYAGARAVLLTHWAVESTSAEVITTRIFQHQSSNPSASRAELHRLAMLDVISMNASGARPSDRFSYAHPLFWAPFALAGDPGRPGQ